MALYDTDAGRLDKFIFDHLQPNQEFLSQVGSAIDFICAFLRENCFRNAPPPRPRVLKVVKGGSSGKGTALKGGSDADLVVFLDIFKTYKDQEQNRKEIIQEIRERLEELKNKRYRNVIFEQTTWSNPRVLSFTLCSNDNKDSIKFDVLPAFDALGQRTSTRPPTQVYIDLINSSSQGGEFSPCFTELQRDFIIDRPTKLKSLILLLKHWYKENYKQLCIFWTKNYDFQNRTLRQYLMVQLRKPRPVILDPADPTGLLGEQSRWDLLAKEAEHCLNQKCCTKNYVPSALHWDVPLLTGEMHSVNIAASRTVWDLKIQIAQKSQVPPYQQKLACRNSSHLPDGAQLSELGLKYGDPIMMVLKNEEPITIFLKNDKAKTRTYEGVRPSETVANFKAHVQKKENIRAEQFWLTFEGRSLEDAHKLSDYNIAPHSTIYLNLRLRGGWIGQAGLLSFVQCFSDF